MVPVTIGKEKSGYVINSLLVRLQNAALELAVYGYTDPHAVDRAWKIGHGDPMGPFEVFDMIGLMTPYNLLSRSDGPMRREMADWLKENHIDKGKLSISTGEGFHTYPRPDA